MIENELSEFDKGWWNCFLTFASDMLEFGSYGGEELLRNVLRQAGVSKSEIDLVIRESLTSDEIIINFLKSVDL